jgi:hypothetical protein
VRLICRRCAASLFASSCLYPSLRLEVAESLCLSVFLLLSLPLCLSLPLSATHTLSKSRRAPWWCGRAPRRWRHSAGSISCISL